MKGLQKFLGLILIILGLVSIFSNPVIAAVLLILGVIGTWNAERG